MKKGLFSLTITLSVILLGSIVFLPTCHADDSGDTQSHIADLIARYDALKSGVDQATASEDLSGFDTQQAMQSIHELGDNIDSLASQLQQLQTKAQVNEQGYSEVLAQVKSVIININETKKSVSDAITKINIFTNDIATTITNMEETKQYIEASKVSLAHFVQVLYLLQNDFYGGDNNIDDVKLLLKSDNISATLSEDDIIQALTLQFNQLISDMTEHQTEYDQDYDHLIQARASYKDTVLGYQSKIESLQEQKAYLMDFLKLYKENKMSFTSQIVNLFETRAQLRARIGTLISGLHTIETSYAFLNSANYIAFKALKDDAETNKNFFLRPILPVTAVSNYFSLSGTQTGEVTPDIQVPAEQYQPIYAPANGIVYQLSDQDGLAVNWMIIMHNDGYVTIYTNINRSLVHVGDIVKRGQIIALVGGQPGTRGAGFDAQGPGLYFTVLHDGVPVDPLSLLDLSVIPDKTILSPTYWDKYDSDTTLRSVLIDLSHISFMEGDTLAARRYNFLQGFGAAPYNDITLWDKAAQDTNIDEDLGICIGYAETSLGKAFASVNNIGNVGNNDRGDRVDEPSVLQGAQAIYDTLDNSLLGNYYTISELSAFGNKDGAIYASSQYNRQKNVSSCLSMIKGYIVPQDYPFRTYSVDQLSGENSN